MARWFLLQNFGRIRNLTTRRKDTNPDNVRFVESIGVRIDEKISVCGKEYTITDIRLYGDMNLTHQNINKRNGFYFDLHIIVRESNN